MKAVKFIKVGNHSFLGGNAKTYVACLGDKFGYLPNEATPYMPIGGVKALKSVINILIFK